MIDFSNKRILVCVAHPDDELLGCGATMNRLIKNESCVIRTVILGEGITSRSDNRDQVKWQEELVVHKQNIEAAKKCIGYDSVSVYDFPDNRFDSVNLLDIVKVVEKEKEIFEPEIIFTHHGGDLNIDHQKTFESVVTATRPMKGEFTKTIISIETPSGTEWRAPTDPKHFIPNFYFQVGIENVEAKIKGMECYEFEKREYPHPRSPEALMIQAQNRGIQVGFNYAEAFHIVRHIIS